MRCACELLPREFLPRKEKPMKRAVRMLVLMLGLASTYMVAAVPRIPVLDAGPIPMCPPRRPNCGM
jgi:hypothetical protein